MLLQFRFKNFRSFQEEQIFSMVVTSDKTALETNSALSDSFNRRILKSAVIYGPNASGKSNLIFAFRFFKRFVTNSQMRRPDDVIPIEPFLLDENNGDSRSEFEATFMHKGVRYQYGFIVNRIQVFEEWLFAYPKGLPQKWYERSITPESGEPQYYFGPQLKGEKERLVSLTRPDTLFLDVAARFNHTQLSKVYEWFRKSLVIIEGDRISDPGLSRTARLAQQDQAFKENLGQLLRFADLGIDDVVVKEPEPIKELVGDNDYAISGSIGRNRPIQVWLQHQRHEATGAAEIIPFEAESKGTQKLFVLAAPLFDALKNGQTVVIDELDSSLHPLLAQELIRMFHDPTLNANNAQLIFNTHDTTLLDSSIFRRDQVWFVEKDKQNASHLYPLADFSPRKEELLEKWYLRGRYGAVPVINWAELWNEDSADGAE